MRRVIIRSGAPGQVDSLLFWWIVTFSGSEGAWSLISAQDLPGGSWRAMMVACSVLTPPPPPPHPRYSLALAPLRPYCDLRSDKGPGSATARLARPGWRLCKGLRAILSWKVGGCGGTGGETVGGRGVEWLWKVFSDAKKGWESVWVALLSTCSRPPNHPTPSPETPGATV